MLIMNIKIEFIFSYSLCLACGGMYSGRNGSFQSPNWPNNYPNSVMCQYLIQVDDNSVVNLYFDDEFMLESGYDFIKVS